MRLREFMVSTVFMSLALVTTKAIPPSVRDDVVVEPAAASVALPVEPSPLISEDKVLGSAYYDTLSILSTSNACSDFFGGSTASVEVFNKFMGKVRKTSFFASIGMRMSGPTTIVFNATTRSHYRLFDRVSLNTNGAFYRRIVPNLDTKVPGVGSFRPNTKEARVLIFLHELGHVMKGQDGKWLLPDDGQNEDLSKQNSQTIEKVCGAEIKSLGKAKAPSFPEHAQPGEGILLASLMLMSVN